MKYMVFPVGVICIVIVLLSALLTVPVKCHRRETRSGSFESSGSRESKQDEEVFTLTKITPPLNVDGETVVESTMKPPTVSSNSVRFILYTPNNTETGQELIVGSESLLHRSNYIRGAPLKIIVHGFGKNAHSGHSQNLKSSYLQGTRKVNVVLVDWEHMARRPWYPTAVTNTKIVGETSGQFILFLVDQGILKLEDVHFIGHSLGAHAAGFAGRYIGDGKIGRITALDPAAPRFESVSDTRRVDSSDAAFVDVIHTSGMLGLSKPLGHADFYPNGGKKQPGCGSDYLRSCRHKRASYYMIESINDPSSFVAWRCDSWAAFSRGNCYNNDATHMGEHVSKTARGTYFLKTNSQEPFSW